MSESFVFFLREDASLDGILEGAAREAWRLERRVPRRGDSAASWTWATGEGASLRLVELPLFGVRCVDWQDERPMPGWLEAAVVRRSAGELAERAREAGTPDEKIATLCEALAGFGAVLPAVIGDVLVLRMRDSSEAVRWMAFRALTQLSEATLDVVLGALLAGEPVPADIEPGARKIRELVLQSLRGEYTDDLETKDAHDLEAALSSAFEAKKWRRVEVAAARLLWKDMPLHELEAAAAWAAAMAVKGHVWKAWFAALLVSELDRAKGKEGIASGVRAEVEPHLASQKEPPTREDMHPILWLLREGSREEYGDALARTLDALDAHVPNLQIERILMRTIAAASSRGPGVPVARELAKKLRDLLPSAITPRALLAHYHGWDDASDEALFDYDGLAEALARCDLAAKGKAEPQTREEASLDAWAEGILHYQAQRPRNLARGHVRVYQKRGDYEGALRATERAIEAQDSAVAWMDKGVILTALERHDDAIAAYSEAIARVGKDGMVFLGGSYDLAWFNRACERALTRDHEGALRDLAEAIRQDKQWIEKARVDDYFDSLRADPRFERILGGDLAAAPPDASPPKEWVREPAAPVAAPEEAPIAEPAAGELPPWERDPFGNPYFDSEFNRRLYSDDEGEDEEEHDEDEYDEGDEDFGDEDDEDDEGDDDE
jgi:tetratricopeptide (TPR) repeat protein